MQDPLPWSEEQTLALTRLLWCLSLVNQVVEETQYSVDVPHLTYQTVCSHESCSALHRVWCASPLSTSLMSLDLCM